MSESHMRYGVTKKITISRMRYPIPMISKFCFYRSSYSCVRIYRTFEKIRISKVW